MISFNRKLKNLIIKYKGIPEEELNEACEISQREEKSLGTVLVKKGMIHEKELIGIISQETNIPPIDLEKLETDEDLLKSIPKELAEEYKVFPVSRLGNLLTLALFNPFDILKLDDLRIVTGFDIRPVISSEKKIFDAIERGYNPGEKEMAQLFQGVVDPEFAVKESGEAIDDNISLADLSEEDSPVVKLVNLIIFQAIKEGASDIHIEPYDKKIRIRYRHDGVLSETFSPPPKMHNAIVSRIKIMSNLDIAEKRKSQDGKFQVRVEGRQVDFRVSVLPVVHGEKVVLRILDASNLALGLETLGFEESALLDFKRAIRAPFGMILVTGPTGSGKSTTLYSAVKEIQSIEKNFVTVEDPVEYQIDGVNQVQANPKRGVTFSSALRSILRQDPDVILIGEIRDKETLDIAVKAALTGHLVLSTLHTNDATSTITRMVDMGLDAFLVGSSVILIAAQRLIRRLCDYCKEPIDVPPERLQGIGFQEGDIQKKFKLFKAVGCPRCKMGFKGRFALLETLVMTENIKRMVIEGKSSIDMKHEALKEGMLTLRRAGLLNAMRGNTSIEEVLRVTMAD